MTRVSAVRAHTERAVRVPIWHLRQMLVLYKPLRPRWRFCGTALPLLLRALVHG
jgi:hypothetical protein